VACFLSAALLTGAGMKPICQSLSNSFAPRLRGLCLQWHYQRGDSVQPTCCPHSSSFTPYWGGFFVSRSCSLTEDGINPECHPLLLCLSPLLGGVLVFVVFNVVNVFDKLKIS